MAENPSHPSFVRIASYRERKETLDLHGPPDKIFFTDQDLSPVNATQSFLPGPYEGPRSKDRVSMCTIIIVLLIVFMVIACLLWEWT
ncbi:hypothetical protein L596_010197 [Steinernema carpocapsae]|uniref:Uncharacterized protein n=1 Tax=Steinernema carpocapsae TaxID=34508 RepID=A0A4U5PIX8_STECR|nr:hypothetical protein L596_010197 [Steinernema carpocapsae]